MNPIKPQSNPDKLRIQKNLPITKPPSSQTPQKQNIPPSETPPIKAAKKLFGTQNASFTQAEALAKTQGTQNIYKILKNDLMSQLLTATPSDASELQQQMSQAISSTMAEHFGEAFSSVEMQETIGKTLHQYLKKAKGKDTTEMRTELASKIYDKLVTKTRPIGNLSIQDLVETFSAQVVTSKNRVETPLASPKNNTAKPQMGRPETSE